MRRTAQSNAKVLEVPSTYSKVVVEEPKAKRKDFPFQGFIDFQGIEIDVENVKGSTRSGTGPEGDWSTYMHAHYGEIRNTEGADGDKLDVYVGDNHDSPLVVVIHQHNPWDGTYDEDKVVLGCESLEEAIGLYKKQYDRPGFYKPGEHTLMPMGAFWRWVHEEKNRGKRLKLGTVQWSEGLPSDPAQRRSLHPLLAHLNRRVASFQLRWSPKVRHAADTTEVTLDGPLGRWLVATLKGSAPVTATEVNHRIATLQRIESEELKYIRIRLGYAQGEPASVLKARQLVEGLLALLRAVQWNHLTSHWQSQGTSSYGDHLLFQRLYEVMGDEIDTLAEKAMGMFGAGSVDPTEQAQRMSMFMQALSREKDPYRRGLYAENLLQRELSSTREGLQQLKQLPLGMDDFLAATASTHDTHVYLLQQRLNSGPIMKTDAVRTVAARYALFRGVR